MKFKIVPVFVVFVVFVVLLRIIIKGTNGTNTNEKLEYSADDADYIDPIIVKNIITQEEANYLINKTKLGLEDSNTLGGLDINTRKSKQLWIDRKDDNVVKEIYDRLSKQFNFNVENTESLQIVKYLPGGYYKEHHDSCCDKDEYCEKFIENSGQRILTILIYLNDDYEGAYTTFYSSYDNKNGFVLEPKKGMVCLMDQDIGHCVPELIFGTKYIIRTELMYLNEDINNISNNSFNNKDIKIINFK
jgi:prolyl 4-hydroxylase